MCKQSNFLAVLALCVITVAVVQAGSSGQGGGGGARGGSSSGGYTGPDSLPWGHRKLLGGVSGPDSHIYWSSILPRHGESLNFMKHYPSLSKDTADENTSGKSGAKKLLGDSWLGAAARHLLGTNEGGGSGPESVSWGGTNFQADWALSGAPQRAAAERNWVGSAGKRLLATEEGGISGPEALEWGSKRGAGAPYAINLDRRAGQPVRAYTGVGDRRLQATKSDSGPESYEWGGAGANSAAWEKYSADVERNWVGGRRRVLSTNDGGASGPDSYEWGSPGATSAAWNKQGATMERNWIGLGLRRVLGANEGGTGGPGSYDREWKWGLPTWSGLSNTYNGRTWQREG